MIQELETEVSEIERVNIDCLHKTSFAQELHEDAHSWTMVNWPKLKGYPARFFFRNEQMDIAELIFWDEVRYTTRVFPSPTLRGRPPTQAA